MSFGYRRTGRNREERVTWDRKRERERERERVVCVSTFLQLLENDATKRGDGLVGEESKHTGHRS